MLGMAIKILLVEDNKAEARFLQELLKGSRFQQFSLFHVQRLQEALNLLHQEYFDIILLDLSLPDSHGLQSLAPLISQAPNLPIVVLTNTNDDYLAIEAVRQGAQDFLVKRQVNDQLLIRSICYAIERKQIAESLRKVNKVLEIQVHERTEELVKAKELNQLKSEFVSMFSHDFRNPLTTILLSTGLLQDNQHKLTQEQKLRHFQQIRTAIKNMVGLLDEVLLLGKADSGKLKCQLYPLNLEPFCHQILKELQLGIGKNHQLMFTIQGESYQGLWDENILRHILNNLLGNAIKYSPEGTQVKLALIYEQHQVIFRIEDQGIGIPLEDQENLFQPFNRGGNVENVPGTGLGLAIVQQCVTAHGGEISVKSKEGCGTIFNVSLPLKLT